ncbi:11661_t:CDS:2 [Paraglomus brasilianum]|uniref:11661_t:CDS:1 n=1 Tax=Paraglomus brasilianum TaxID=144538 RepID=A0A9N9BQU5_9GLOM|nr:11661_t:CDS:2 [Paraglomus brasilianum]
MTKLSRWFSLVSFVLASLCAAVIDAVTEHMTYSSPGDVQFRCYGLYAKSAIPNGVDPFVSVNAQPLSNAKEGSSVAFALFEWHDQGNIGHEHDGVMTYICDDTEVEAKHCTESQKDGFIVTEGDKGSVDTFQFDFNSSDKNATNLSHKYEIQKTGYYCMLAYFTDGGFEAHVEWKNPYGELPGSDYPKLPFYGLLSLVYLAIGIVWMVLSILHWREILQVQNYISGVILFLMIEMAFNWGYWENYNNTGHPSTALAIVVSVLNAGRNSISFFMLLIVCMGYGVVKPTLGSTMNKCRALAGAHFVFGIIYSAGVLGLDSDTAGPLVLVVILPLALTMTAFYVWTLQSLTHTIQTLEIRKQTVKSLMYRRLYRLLVFSVAILGVFFIVNMLNYIHHNDFEWPARYWHYKWFLLDGWLNILYLVVFLVIIILWRPTKNNKRYPFTT